jgi:predicted DNA-binding transcriptional regulator YafY
MTTPNVQVVSEAIQNRVWLRTVYQSYDPDTGKTLLRKRSILPFRVYESKEGNYVIDGYDTYRESIRTFRLDRFESMELGRKLDITSEADPNIVVHRGDFVVWPAAWNLIQARPQIVSERSLPKFLEHGWSLTPCASVIVKPS